jgi:hypothetical protein
LSSAFFDQKVVSPLDKNGKCVFIEDVKSYGTRMHRSFIEDPHYDRIHRSAEDILDDMQNFYKKKKWKRFGPFSAKSDLGYAYVLPKNKDPIGKDRPIIPATKHPLRKTLCLVSRIWLYIFKRVKGPHFNITATHDLKVFVESLNLRNACDWHLISFDVKNMFTELDHLDILTSLEWMLSLARKQLKSNIFSIFKSGSKEVFMGHSSSKKQLAVFRLKDILQFAKFELENTFFRVGTTIILKQKKGISMGGYQSPPMAMIVAAAAEHKWMSSLGADQKYIRGARYVDDGVVFFDLNRLKQPLDVYVEALKNDVYPPSLELEITGQGLHTQILEAEVHIQPSCVTLRHFNKNATSVLLGDGQKIRKFIPWSSAHSKSLFRNVILGLLHRMSFNTTVDSINTLAWAWKAYVIEMKTLCYPSSVIKEAIMKFLCHTRIQEFKSNWKSVLFPPLLSIYESPGLV